MVGVRAGSVDRVLAVECAFYFDRPRFYAEAARVLKRGGRMVLADICFHDSIKRLTGMSRKLRNVGYAGQNRADPGSMKAAIRSSICLRY